MTVSAFVKKYNEFQNQKSKDTLLQQMKKRDYVPVFDKCAMLQLAFDKSVNKMDNGIQYINMFVNKMNFRTTMLALYTNLTCDKITDKDGKETLDVAGAYDLLKANGLWEKIDELIGEDELTECLSINQSIMDTWHEQYSTTQAWVMECVDHVVRTFSMMANDGMGKLVDMIEDPEKFGKVKELVNGVIEKIKK